MNIGAFKIFAIFSKWKYFFYIERHTRQRDNSVFYYKGFLLDAIEIGTIDMRLN